MRTILLAFAHAEAAAKVKAVLVAAGLPVGRVFATGAALLQQALLEPGGGVIVLPPRLSDMSVPDLLSRLPDTFDLVVLHGKGQPATFGQLPGITFLESPLPPQVLVETVRNLLETRTAGGRTTRPPPGRIDSRRDTGRDVGWSSGTGFPAGRTGPGGGAQAPSQRSAAEEQMLRKAKAYLINECGLTEEQAHRNLQKRSMESGTRLAEIARRVLEEADSNKEEYRP